MKMSLIVALAGGALGFSGSALAQDSGPERVVITHAVIDSSTVVVPVPIPVASGKPEWDRASNGGGSGGLGGAIGGYYINGTTRSDNRPLPGSTWPYR